MTKTTITVDSAVRDRLAGLAHHHHRALGDELAALLDGAETRLFWEQVLAGYGRQREEPGAADDAAPEFPEYAELAAVGPLATPADLVDEMPEHPTDRIAG